MEKLLQLLNQNWIGVIIGIAGIILAYIFYRRSQIRQRLAFQSSSFRVVGRNSGFPPDLEIFYRGKSVPKVTSSTIVIWNRGNATILGQHIVSSDPLRIVVIQGSEILDVEIIRVSRDTNDFRASISPKSVNVVEYSFDYLDPNDGAVIRMIHTGDASVELEGTVRGIPEGILNLGSFRKSSRVIEFFFGFVVPMIFAVLLLILSFANEYLNNDWIRVCIVIITVLFQFFLLQKVRLLWLSKAPRGLMDL